MLYQVQLLKASISTYTCFAAAQQADDLPSKVAAAPSFCLHTTIAQASKSKQHMPETDTSGNFHLKIHPAVTSTAPQAL
jgi:hypothetical protein